MQANSLSNDVFPSFLAMHVCRRREKPANMRSQLLRSLLLTRVDGQQAIDRQSTEIYCFAELRQNQLHHGDHLD